MANTDRDDGLTMLELSEAMLDLKRNIPVQSLQMIAAKANLAAPDDLHPALLILTRDLVHIEVTLHHAGQLYQLRLHIPFPESQLEQLTQSSEGTE